jgi:hypothetical protein
MLRALLLGVVLGLGTVAAAQAATTTVGPAQDTYLDSFNTTTNYGTSTYYWTGTSTGKVLAVYRTLLRFDLSALAGSTLSSATLSQYASTVQAANVSFSVCRLAQAAWTETGATWSTYDGTHAWASPGGDYTTSDPACVSFTGPSTTGAFNVTVTGLAQDALANRGGQLQMLIKRAPRWPPRSSRGDSSCTPVRTQCRPALPRGPSSCGAPPSYAAGWRPAMARRCLE